MAVGRKYCCAFLQLILLLSLAACSEPEQVDQRPNFIIFVADDLGWNDVGAYGNGDVYTPNIDMLASTGARFTNVFLTTSSCSASRASILTGRYPHSNGLVNLHQPLSPQETTVASLLSASGYFTGAAGKWHLGGSVKSQFDVVKEDRGDSGTDYWLEIVRERPVDRPFFLWMASRDPHLPHTRGDEFRSRYSPKAFELPQGYVDGAGVREELLRYYQEVSSFDADIGLVLEELRGQGALDNTVVIVMSDNGRPFYRGKLFLYDDGIKTPFVVHWPQGLVGQRDYGELVSAVDLAPTLLSLADLPVPQYMQGISFAAALTGADWTGREFVYAERNEHREPAHERAIRSTEFLYKENQFPLGGDCVHSSFKSTASFKAVEKTFRRGLLQSDIAECFARRRPMVELFAVSELGVDFRNLAEEPEYAGVRKAMSRQLKKWRDETDDFDFDRAAKVR